MRLQGYGAGKLARWVQKTGGIPSLAVDLPWQVAAVIFAVLAVVVPLLFSLRRFPSYERRVVPIASVVVALIAAVWIVERVTGRELIPG